MRSPIITYLSEKLLFFPCKAIEFYPGYWGLEYENIKFESQSGHVLHGWFIPGGPQERTLIYYHGNAGNIGDRLSILKQLHGIGMNVFIFDYQGFGASEGVPSIDGVPADSLAAYDYLVSRADVNENHIILYGESLGGHMAIHVAGQRRHAGLILQSTFTTVKDMAKRKYWPLAPLAPDIYRSIDLITYLHEPILILHGDEDPTVPYQMGEALYQAAPHPKRFVPFKGGGHVNLHEVNRLLYTESIDTFLADIGE